jgi:hypothetical protein
VLDREAWLATVDADEVLAMLREVGDADGSMGNNCDKHRIVGATDGVAPSPLAQGIAGDGSSDSIPVSDDIGRPDRGDRVGQPAVAVTPTIFECEAFSEDGILKVRVAPGANDLGSLFRKYGTDKDVNGYTPFYEALFETKRGEIKAVLEIGIGTMDPDAPYSMVGYAQPGYRPGGSLRAWRDWFPNAEIMGLVRQPDCLFSEDRITTALGDSTYRFDLPGYEFDIIIDDGNHSLDAQLKTLENCLPLLREADLRSRHRMDNAYAVLHEIVGPRPWRCRVCATTC